MLNQPDPLALYPGFIGKLWAALIVEGRAHVQRDRDNRVGGLGKHYNDAVATSYAEQALRSLRYDMGRATVVNKERADRIYALVAEHLVELGFFAEAAMIAPAKRERVAA